VTVPQDYGDTELGAVQIGTSPNVSGKLGISNLQGKLGAYQGRNLGPRQTRQLPRAVDLKGRLLSCQSY